MAKLEKEIIINSAQGLHARPAAMFVQTVSKYNSNVTLTKDGQKINGKSIMGILTLGAQQGDKVLLEVDGEDAEKLMPELEALLLEE